MEKQVKSINVSDVYDKDDLSILAYTVSRLYHVDEENIIFDEWIFREVVADYEVSNPYLVKYRLSSFIVEIFAPEISSPRADYYAWVHF